jgi:hypothetical protein
MKGITSRRLAASSEVSIQQEQGMKIQATTLASNGGNLAETATWRNGRDHRPALYNLRENRRERAAPTVERP